jgi:hypothetical protein
MVTNLTPEEQAAILCWPHIRRIGFIEADSRNKTIGVKNWQKIDLDNIDYEANLQAGRYDNGIAIRLGKTLTNGRNNDDDKPLYTFALDFDGENAVNEWFGTWENVLKLSQKTRVEWHEDKTRIHVICMSERPVTNKRIHIENSFLEVRCENNLLFVSPSIHKDGRPYCPMGTEEICILPEMDLLRFEARIEGLSSEGGYMSDDDRAAYDKWLDLPKTILGEGQGRHDALKFKIIRYYYKYEKHWRKYTDQQRFDLAWVWNERHCDPPKSREEFDSLCKWVVKHHTSKRDEIHKNLPRESPSVIQTESLMFLAKNICKEFFLDQYQKPYAAIIGGGVIGTSSEEFFLEQARQEEIEYEMAQMKKAFRELDETKVKEINLRPVIAIPPTRTETKPIIVGGHVEVVPLESKRFRNYILGIYYKITRNRIPNAESVKNVINVLCYLADFEGSRKHLHERVAGIPTWSIQYDLTNKDWEMVEVTSRGWNVKQAPIIFRRHNNELPQVYPSREYPEDIFDQFIELLNVKTENDKLLLKCYIISLFIPEIQKPILMLYGEQGSAKSTLQELIKMLVDPRLITTLSFPRNIAELVQVLSHNYVAYFNNISSIDNWISDELCRAVTGSGFSKRMLFTDDEDVVYNFKRCIGFNGINLAATRPDLLDRGIILLLERISKIEQKEEGEIKSKFESIKPKVLGYLVKVINGTVQSIELKEKSRLSDFERYAEAISRSMHYEENKFIDAYNKNRELQTQQVLETSVVAPILAEFMESKKQWEGTASELLVGLDLIAINKGLSTKIKFWPKTASSLSRRLNEIRTNLREAGIDIEWIRDNAKSRTRTIKLSKLPSAPSVASDGEK